MQPMPDAPLLSWPAGLNAAPFQLSAPPPVLSQQQQLQTQAPNSDGVNASSRKGMTACQYPAPEPQQQNLLQSQQAQLLEILCAIPAHAQVHANQKQESQGIQWSQQQLQQQQWQQEVPRMLRQQPASHGAVLTEHSLIAADILPQYDFTAAASTAAHHKQQDAQHSQQHLVAAVTAEPPTMIAAAAAAGAFREAATAATAAAAAAGDDDYMDSTQWQAHSQPLHSVHHKHDVAGPSRLLQQITAAVQQAKQQQQQQQMCMQQGEQRDLLPQPEIEQQQQDVQQLSTSWTVADSPTMYTAAEVPPASGGGCSSEEDDAAAALVMLWCGKPGQPAAAGSAGQAAAAAAAALKGARSKVRRTARQQQQPGQRKRKHALTNSLPEWATRTAAAVSAVGWGSNGLGVCAPAAAFHSADANMPVDTSSTGFWGPGALHTVPEVSNFQQQQQQQQHQEGTAAEFKVAPRSMAAAAATAAEAAATGPTSAALLLQKVRQVLQMPGTLGLQEGCAASAAPAHLDAAAQAAMPQGTSVPAAAREAAVPTSPCRLLAAAAAPWYPYQGKLGGLMLLKDGRLVARKLYTLPTGETEDAAAAAAAGSVGAGAGGELLETAGRMSGSKHKLSADSRMQPSASNRDSPQQQQQPQKRQCRPAAADAATLSAEPAAAAAASASRDSHALHTQMTTQQDGRSYPQHPGAIFTSAVAPAAAAAAACAASEGRAAGRGAAAGAASTAEGAGEAARAHDAVMCDGSNCDSLAAAAECNREAAAEHADPLSEDYGAGSRSSAAAAAAASQATAAADAAAGPAPPVTKKPRRSAQQDHSKRPTPKWQQRTVQAEQEHRRRLHELVQQHYQQQQQQQRGDPQHLQHMQQGQLQEPGQEHLQRVQQLQRQLQGRHLQQQPAPDETDIESAACAPHMQQQQEQQQQQAQTVAGPKRPWMKLVPAGSSSSGSPVAADQPAVQPAAAGLQLPSSRAGNGPPGAVIAGKAAACEVTPAAPAAAAMPGVSESGEAPQSMLQAAAAAGAGALLRPILKPLGSLQPADQQGGIGSMQQPQQHQLGATSCSKSSAVSNASGPHSPAAASKALDSSAVAVAANSHAPQARATPVATSASAAVAASRARLLAALGADDKEDLTPAVAPQVAAAALSLPAVAGNAMMGAAAPVAPAAGAQQMHAAIPQSVAPNAAAGAPTAVRATAMYQQAAGSIPMYLQAGARGGRAMLLPVMQLGSLGILPGAGAPGLTQAALLQRMYVQQQLQLQQHLQRQQLMAAAGQAAGVVFNSAGAGGGICLRQGQQQ